jgi:hypothetical protein
MRQAGQTRLHWTAAVQLAKLDNGKLLEMDFSRPVQPEALTCWACRSER